MKHSLELFEQPIPALRQPEPEDSARIDALAGGFTSHGMSSLQGSLMSHDGFRETSVLAEQDGALIGFVSAYRLPNDPQTLFVWRVDVSETARDTGLASLMMGHLMRVQACDGVTRVQTAIKPSDESAWTLFRRFARWQRSRMDIQPFITQALTPFNQHDTEMMVTIRVGGPSAKWPESRPNQDKKAN